MESTSREVDQQYLQLLENKLKNMKNPKKLTGKMFISDLASYKDHQLFQLMSEKNESRGFDDNFVEDETITPNYLQRKIAPQTCAISKQELVKLLKSDTLQMLHEELDGDDFLRELREVAEELKNASLLTDSDEASECGKNTAEVSSSEISENKSE